MIQDDHQYMVTQGWAKKFAQAIENHDPASYEGQDVHPLMAKIYRDALQSQLDTLNEEIREYEALKAGDIPLDPNISASVANLPKSLIRTRIAKGLTQKDLAERMGLKEQQIQRYEASGYESAGLARITEIAWALERE